MRAVPATTRIPHPSPAVIGVFHHEGRIAALIDLHRLAAAPAPAAGRRPAVVVLQHEGHLLGLIVDVVREVLETHHAERAEASPPAAPVLSAITRGRVVARDESGSEDAPPAAAPAAPQFAALLAEAPAWLARIHDPDPIARRQANEKRARTVLAEDAVHLLDVARLWDTIAGRNTREGPA